MSFPLAPLVNLSIHWSRPVRRGRYISSVLHGGQSETSTWTPTRFSCRCLAQVTGHKKTNRKNKKKRQAIERKRIKKIPLSLRPKQGIKKKSKKAPFYDTPTPPDYPLGPNYKPSESEAEEPGIPPALLSITASPHVYVSTFVCEESEIDPLTLYKQLPSLDQFRCHGYGPSGSFHYFSPQLLDYAYPTVSQPEVAFIGRSNVGKSSLINGIIRKKLALTSKQPGRTQQPYYYGWVENEAMSSKGLKEKSASAFIVDLPGYGYAVGPDKAVSSWQESTQEYLLARHQDSKTLRRVFLLQDARLGLPQPIDDTVASWLEDAGIPYTIVLTKSDDSRLAIKHANLCALKYQQLRMATDSCFMSPIMHVTSAKKETGLIELLSSVVTEFETKQSEFTPQPE